MDINSIVALGSLVIALVSIVVNFMIVRGQQVTKNLEAKRGEINKKLSDFYGPMLQHRHKSAKLHERFKNGRDFRTLTKLLEGEVYSGNDLLLIKEIIAIGKKCEELIEKQAGLIDEKSLRAVHLPKASRHFFIIRNAFEKRLEGDVNRFKGDVFPKEIDHILETRFSELQEELDSIDRKIRRFIW